jgi:hypothetical protein
LRAAIKCLVPAVYYLSDFAREGGLLSYGPDNVDTSRRAASYVDRILRGEKPGDLPVQLPTKFEMVVNLKATKAIVAHRQGKRIQAWQGHGILPMREPSNSYVLRTFANSRMRSC